MQYQALQESLLHALFASDDIAELCSYEDGAFTRYMMG